MYVILRILKHMALVDFVTLPTYSLEQWAIFMKQNLRYGAGFGPVGSTEFFLQIS